MNIKFAELEKNYENHLCGNYTHGKNISRIIEFWTAWKKFIIEHKFLCFDRVKQFNNFKTIFLSKLNLILIKNKFSYSSSSTCAYSHMPLMLNQIKIFSSHTFFTKLFVFFHIKNEKRTKKSILWFDCFLHMHSIMYPIKCRVSHAFCLLLAFSIDFDLSLDNVKKSAMENS